MFNQFDIREFYPSIYLKLLNGALDWAQGLNQVSKHDRDIIMEAKSTFLDSKGQKLSKKNPTNYFSVTMGLYGGVETCELVGLFILQRLCTLGINLQLIQELWS